MRLGFSRLAVVLAAFVVPSALFACGDDDSQPGPKDATAAEAGPMPDTSVGGEDASVVDAAPGVGQCAASDYMDFTTRSGPVTISFPTDPAPAQYTNRCVKVKAGTVVTFSGTFSMHPLEPNGGTTPTPIPALTNTASDGGSVLPITFAAAGTFGFECNFHPQIMFGAVQVVP